MNSITLTFTVYPSCENSLEERKGEIEGNYS